MVIAIVFEIFLPVVNGVITTTINLAENLRSKGHKVIFIVPAWKAFDDPYINGIPVRYISSLPTSMYPGVRFVSPFNRQVEKVMVEENVDVIHITGPWLLTWAAIRAGQKHNIPVVHTFHTLIYEDNYLYYVFRTRLLVPFLRFIAWKYIGLYINRSDIVTAPSLHACNVLKQHFPEADIRHIRNGIDLEVFKRYSDYETLLEKYPQFNRKTFLFVGRLGEEKSISVLLDAFVLAYRKDPELRLFIIGEGPGRNEYERYVKDNSLEDVILFLGRIDHEELLQSGLFHYSKALVTASVTENQPITVIEAIACNTPIIVPDVDGINELLVGNGLSFSENDRELFAGSMLELASNEELFRKCCNEGLKIREEFDGEKVAGQFEEIYEKLL